MTPPEVEPDPLEIARSLAGQRLLVSGATGFIGKVLVEKLLWSVPEVGELVLLLRPRRGDSVEERVRREILDSPVMARLRARHQAGWEEWARSKLRVVEGDLATERLGLDASAWQGLAQRIDRVVSCAASVTFDERVDRATSTNVRGAVRLLELARAAGDVPLLHLSTCFVSGRSSGTIEESAGDFGFDSRTLLAELDRACAEVEGDDGDEAAVAKGREVAAAHRFNDVYTLTKALAERMLEEQRGGVPLAIVRPGIVESALAQPRPGWIEAVRVADPLLVAYGRGRLRELPADPEGRLELIPVDFVVHATLAALADLGPATTTADAAQAGFGRGDVIRRRDGGAGGPAPVRYYQVGSSRNPLTLGELLAHARDGFAQTPLRDQQGRAIEVPPVRFVSPGDELRPANAGRTDRQGRDRVHEHFARLFEVYGPYLDHPARYDDTATRALSARLTDTERAAFPFDVAQLDWRDYVARMHVPGLQRFALCAESGEPPPSPGPASTLSRARLGELGSLGELLIEVARRHPDRIALQTFRQGRWLRYTYRQALTATSNIAACLAQRHGIGSGDRVVLWTTGSPEWVLMTMALWRLGAVAVPLDPQWPPGEVVDAAKLVGAKLICAMPRLHPALASAADPACPVVELAAPLVPEPDVELLPGAEAFASLAAPAASQDLASILFTSGTTVAPKAVPLTHANYLANVRDLVPLMELEGERLLSVLPVHHVFEQMVGLLVPLAGASTVSYVAELKPDEIRWMMSTTRPTVLVAVPRLLELLHGGIERSVAAGGPMLGLWFKLMFALSKATGGRYGHRLFAKVHQRFGGSLRRIATGGAALDPDLGRRFFWMGFRVAEGYGMTETAPVLSVNPWREIRFGSVGRPLPSVEFQLREVEVEGEGAEETVDVGEIWVRGPNVMSGYHDNPEATAEVMQGEWLNTGDLGRFDGDGYLHLCGRTKEMIVTDAGKNVYPEEVERRYRDLPMVEDLVVLGLPSATGRGEVVCAVVAPKATASEDDVMAIWPAIHERSRQVPSYQRIGRVEIWRGDLPKTSTLKVRRAALRKALLAGENGAAAGAAAPAPSAASPASRVAGDDTELEILEILAGLLRSRAELLGPGDRLSELGV
ncbi:MAG: NAD-dependent epimerase/dehydratase family protein, partial [Acidobacteria bacterium]